jgi:ribosome recycling factor
MEEDLDLIIDVAKESMENAIEHLSNEMSKVRAGKANPSMIDSVNIEYYGSKSPIAQIATISTPDAHTLRIQPWEKQMLVEIEKAIMNSNLGLNPQNNGEVIMINIPPLTEERRKNLAKQIKGEAENAKISIRNIRRDANDSIKKLQKDGLAEDMAKGGEETVQKITDTFISKIDELSYKKEIDIMKV